MGDGGAGEAEQALDTPFHQTSSSPLGNYSANPEGPKEAGCLKPQEVVCMAAMKSIGAKWRHTVDYLWRPGSMCLLCRGR